MTERASGAPRGVLTDFGGVLTTSVLESFRAASARLCGDASLVLKVLADGGSAAKALSDHECGRMSQEEFEIQLAECLRQHGVDVRAAGLVKALQADMKPDHAMLEVIRRLRNGGVPVAIVSNSLGDDCYAGFDLEEIADAVVISGSEGVRKPSRRLFVTACEQIGVPPQACVMIDDLRHNLEGAARLGIRGLHHTESGLTIAELEELFDLTPSGPQAPA